MERNFYFFAYYALRVFFQCKYVCIFLWYYSLIVSMDFGVWSVTFDVWSVTFGVWSVTFGVWNDTGHAYYYLFITSFSRGSARRYSCDHFLLYCLAYDTQHSCNAVIIFCWKRDHTSEYVLHSSDVYFILKKCKIYLSTIY